MNEHPVHDGREPIGAGEADAEGGEGAPVATADPWAHRRAEPRLFAFLWSVYVLAAVMGSILWVARLPEGAAAEASAYSPAARTMLVVIAAGITVLWPMTRLSQAAPERDPVASTLADLLVVQMPVQMVIWPMALLARWPAGVVAAIALLFLAWGLVAGGLVAVAFASGGRGRRGGRGDGAPGGGARAAWMVVCVLAVGAAPALGLLATGATGEPASGRGGWWAMASPFTAIYAVSGRGWSGPTAAVGAAQWVGMWVTACVGVGLWVAAAVVSPAGGGRSGGLH